MDCEGILFVKYETIFSGFAELVCSGRRLLIVYGGVWEREAQWRAMVWFIVAVTDGGDQEMT